MSSILIEECCGWDCPGQPHITCERPLGHEGFHKNFTATNEFGTTGTAWVNSLDPGAPQDDLSIWGE